MTRRVVAERDPTLRARVTRATPLLYAAGADRSLDRPAHVRAGSGLAWMGGRLAVVQDDTGFVALVDPGDGHVAALPLPVGPGGRRQFDDLRGNKADKLDLEAVVAIPLPGGSTTLVALGSGSTARRERVVLLRGLGRATEDVAIEVASAPAFYARLRDAVAFSGSELNVEAAVLLDDATNGRLRLFNRGNGASRGGLAPVDATCEVSWPALAAHLAKPDQHEPPPVGDVVQYELGEVGGLALTFTDATLVPMAPAAVRRAIVYTAAAEASPDATRDGPVAGCAVGVIDDGPDGARARWALLHDEGGEPFAGKVEGIALHRDDPARAHVVVDRDAPGEPSMLCEVVLEGPWRRDA